MFDFNMPPLDWREAYIPKKSGGTRKLSIPNDELKSVQKDILQYLYSVKALRPSRHAHGFIKYRNTSTGVALHNKTSKAYICMDIEGFFDNFPVDVVKTCLSQTKVGSLLAEKIITACSHNGGLPQGAPTSPYLTNIGMREVDTIIAAYARKRNLIYSRYADDITFSIKPGAEDKNITSYVRVFYDIDKILKERLGLHLKPKKSHIINHYGSSKCNITGVIIRQDGLGYNAPRKLRSKARALAHNLAIKLRSQHGRPTKEDKKTWGVVMGYVVYCDKIRSYSLQQVATADPRINEDDWNYLTKIFIKGK